MQTWRSAPRRGFQSVREIRFGRRQRYSPDGMCEGPGVGGGSSSCRLGGLHHVVVFHLFSRPGVRRFPPSSHAATPRIPLLQGRSRTRTASLSFVRHCVVLCCAERGKAIPAGSDETLVRAPGFCGPLAFLLGQSSSCRPGGLHHRMEVCTTGWRSAPPDGGLHDRDWGAVRWESCFLAGWVNKKTGSCLGDRIRFTLPGPDESGLENVDVDVGNGGTTITVLHGQADGPGGGADARG